MAAANSYRDLVPWRWLLLLLLLLFLLLLSLLRAHSIGAADNQLRQAPTSCKWRALISPIKAEASPLHSATRAGPCAPLQFKLSPWRSGQRPGAC